MAVQQGLLYQNETIQIHTPSDISFGEIWSMSQTFVGVSDSNGSREQLQFCTFENRYT